MKKSTIKISILLIIFLLLTAAFLVYLIRKNNQNISETDLSIKNEFLLQQILVNAHIPKYHYQVINSYPHNKLSFTEGLFLENDYVYESSGLYGQSTLRKIKIDTGIIQKEYSLPAQYFAEGMTVLGDQLYQLTYLEHTGFVYDINTFQIKNTFSYPDEGWGLTTDGKQLIMSNGSATLSFINPATLKSVRSLLVTVNKITINSLNELEFINGMIYANVWPTSIIVIISPQNGKVAGWINIKALKSNPRCSECVANGIAYNKKDKVLIVTGKYWPYMYAIKLLPN